MRGSIIRKQFNATQAYVILHVYRVRRKKNTPYKNLIIFRIIQYFLVKFSEVIRESYRH